VALSARHPRQRATRSLVERTRKLEVGAPGTPVAGRIAFQGVPNTTSGDSVIAVSSAPAAAGQPSITIDGDSNMVIGDGEVWAVGFTVRMARLTGDDPTRFRATVGGNTYEFPGPSGVATLALNLVILGEGDAVPITVHAVEESTLVDLAYTYTAAQWSALYIGRSDA
jgi:hypothetical protein